MSLDLSPQSYAKLQEVETKHPDTAGALDPIIRALSSPEESMVGMEQAQELLGVESVIPIQRWVELGILAGRWDEQLRQWCIPLAEVLRLRGTELALAGAEGTDLTEDELETLSSTRASLLPWQLDITP